MITDRIGKEPKKGDIIMISYGNNLIMGVFNKVGGASNPNYFNLRDYTANNCKKGIKPHNDYIATSRNKRWQIVPKEVLSDEEKEWYEEIIKFIL